MPVELLPFEEQAWNESISGKLIKQRDTNNIFIVIVCLFDYKT